MNMHRTLDDLEGDVMARIARHRAAQLDAGTLPAGITLAVMALTIGLAIGWNQARQMTPQHGSESIVLADDARLAPSSLFADIP